MGKSVLSYVAALAACCFASSEIDAQEMKVVSEPAIGEENTVGAGGDVYSFMRVYTIDGARIDVNTKAGDWLVEQAVPAGTTLVPVETTKKYKGCVPYPGSFEPNGPCFIDDDGDGRFDRHSRDQVVIFRKLKQPVPYTIVPVSIARADSFKRTILYQGATADSLPVLLPRIQGRHGAARLHGGAHHSARGLPGHGAREESSDRIARRVGNGIALPDREGGVSLAPRHLLAKHCRGHPLPNYVAQRFSGPAICGRQRANSPCSGMK